MDATAFEQEVAALVVEALNLDVKPEEIDPSAPLFGDGLGLDSIDVLEISLVVGKKYGVQLKADDKDNTKTFSSLSALAAYIAANRAN
ncbi:phosphopantetheine-binding protein [Viridibacterium curvum]|uniref:Xanthomonadin biosynthesis acyl carrier protein XanC n=1 Tax=Viridibacterium curvum TaxID=1101404 RepID=A0ABP9R047_9RHOO